MALRWDDIKDIASEHVRKRIEDVEREAQTTRDLRAGQFTEWLAAQGDFTSADDCHGQYSWPEMQAQTDLDNGDS